MTYLFVTSLVVMVTVLHRILVLASTLLNGMELTVIYQFVMAHAFTVTVVHPTTVLVTIILNGLDRIVTYLSAM